MAGQAGQPRRSKGSVVSTTYEFPYMRKATERTFGQIIYDSKQGKVLGRTPKNWGEEFSAALFRSVAKFSTFIIIIFSLNLNELSS